MARVGAVLRRSKAMRDLSPLTALPGNFRIGEELQRRVASGRPMAVVHADLDNFKAFNDHYGFMRGDNVIKFTANTLVQAAVDTDDPSCFVGHVGGDDFIAVMHPDVGRDLLQDGHRPLRRRHPGLLRPPGRPARLRRGHRPPRRAPRLPHRLHLPGGGHQPAAHLQQRVGGVGGGLGDEGARQARGGLLLQGGPPHPLSLWGMPPAAGRILSVRPFFRAGCNPRPAVQPANPRQGADPVRSRGRR